MPAKFALAIVLLLMAPFGSDLSAHGVAASDQDLITQGRQLAVFTAIEVKDKGRPTPEQLAFIDVVRKAGGLAGVARSVEEAQAILDGM